MLVTPQTNSTYKTYMAQHSRQINHLVLAFISGAGCLVAALLATPTQSFLETLSIGTGYVGLLLLLATLVMGPLNLLKIRKNPVNLNSRRDAGIWAGIMILVHLVFSFALQFSWTGNVLGLFLNEDGTPKFNLFGISNGFGLIGALVALFLLVLSNNYSLKKYKGKNWKKLQRFNYLLFGLALVHTLTQQINVGRSLVLTFGVILLAIGVVAAQTLGFMVYREREQQRQLELERQRQLEQQRQQKLAPKKPMAPAPRYVGTADSRRTMRVNQSGYYYEAPTVNLAKLAMYVGVGVFLAFIGFVFAQEGTNVLSNVVHAVAPDSSSNSDSSDGGFQFSWPSSSQPSARSHRS
ncbi:MAG: ferric reductase-like transmembrane domain-containing protein [Chloroflexi bacterium]|nr:ferric reductase-like transmembrane domain-containing protein [Chloroflexota bacterium]